MKRQLIISVALLVMSNGGWADVKYELLPSPPEYLTETERTVAVAAMRCSLRALLRALERRDAAEASKFVDPGRRLEFMDAALQTNPGQIAQALSAELECERNIRVRFAQCSYWVKNSIGGLDEVRVPFVSREGQWFVSR